MTSFFGRTFGVALMMAIGSCGAAHAVTVELHYSGVVSAANIAGVSVGDAIIFDVFADNGGAGLNSQTWLASDVTSATFQAGSYSATTSGPLIISGGGFSTDSLGQLATLSLVVF